MAKLTDLGFSKGAIFEVLVSTYNFDGTSNAAPMGASLLDENHLVLNIFNTSSTYQNLLVTKQGTINVTRDVEVFYKATFKEENLNGKLPQIWFEKSQTINAPELRFADATIAFSIFKMEQFEEKTRFTCKVEQITAQETYPKVYCRAISLTFEAMIHATRVKASINSGKEESVKKLIDLIHEYHGVVNRIAPNSSYSLIMEDLIKKIDSWRINL